MNPGHGTAPQDDPQPPDPTGALRISQSVEPDQVELVFHGELDIDTLPIAQHAITTAQRTGPSLLVLNLGELDFLDSSGVRLVLTAERDATDTGVPIAVRLGHGPARRLFDLLGLTARLPLLDDPPGRRGDGEGTDPSPA